MKMNNSFMLPSAGSDSIPNIFEITNATRNATATGTRRAMAPATSFPMRNPARDIGWLKANRNVPISFSPDTASKANKMARRPSATRIKNSMSNCPRRSDNRFGLRADGPSSIPAGVKSQYSGSAPSNPRKKTLKGLGRRTARNTASSFSGVQGLSTPWIFCPFSPAMSCCLSETRRS